MTRRLKRLGLLFAIALLAAGCAAGKAFRQGDAAMRSGDLDQAVAAYRKAMQAAPDNANYRIALQRAMLAASRAHLEKARDYEEQDQLEAALGEYRQASEYDPTNRQAGVKVAALERTIRDRVEAARPPPAIQQLRERARAASPEPILNPASREPLNIRFNNASLRDILNFIGMRDRHQHHLRPRGRRPSGHRAARRRHRRAGAESNPQHESALVQGAERAVDPHLPGHGAKARPIRRPGGPDVLFVQRRRDRDDANSEHHHPSAGHRGAAGHRRQQDVQFHHRSRHGAGRGDPRKDHRAKRQAARRNRRRRGDPRGRSATGPRVTDSTSRSTPWAACSRRKCRQAPRARAPPEPGPPPPPRPGAHRPVRPASSRRRPSTSIRFRGA